MTTVCIVGVGHVSLDHLFNVATSPQPGLKTPARRYRAMVGGMTANALVAAARLGAAARIVSPVGDDETARQFVEHFAAEGIDTRALVRVAGARSSVSAVIVEAGGERTLVNHRGDALARCGAFDAAQIEGADALLADPRCPDWAAAALRAARARGLPSVFDGDVAPREDLQRLAGSGRWAVFSTPGLAAFDDRAAATPDDALGAALAAGAEVAVVTQGEAGLLWRRAGEAAAQRLAAFEVAPVVDTTAAGDVFHGALAVAIAEGRSALDALRFASAAAALKCRGGDGALAAPSRAEVEQLLAAQPAAVAAHQRGGAA
jgi:sulfofructose kinase